MPAAPLPEHARLGDATIFGNALAAPFLDRNVSIAFGSFSKEMNWANTTAPLREVVTSLCTFQRGPKDGLCLLQGAVVEAAADKRGVQRLKTNMAANSILMVDCDRGESLAEIAAKIQAAGLFGVLWSTHSHLKTETLVPEKALERYMQETGRGGAQAAEADVIEYLRQKSKILDVFLTEAKVIDRALREGGVRYIVQHPPMPRLRALFVLKEPYDFANHAGMSQSQAMAEWSRLYAAVSDSLGLPYDRSCADPSRLMYVPRIPKDAVIGEGAHEIVVLAGEPLDLAAFPQVAALSPAHKSRLEPDAAAGDDDDPAVRYARAAAKLAGQAGNTNTVAGGTYTPSRHWLRKFAAVCGIHFQIANWLQAEHEDDVRGKARGDKIEFKCPNQDGHTDPKDTDQAFCVWNAAGSETGFGASCRHDTCINESANDRLWYLDKLCAEYNIDSAEQLMPWVDPEGQAAWAKATAHDAVRAKRSAQIKEGRQTAAEHAEAAAEGRPSTLDDRIKTLTRPHVEADLAFVLAGIASLTSLTTHETLISAVREQTGLSKGSLRKEIAKYQAAAAKQAAAEAGETEDRSPPADLSTLCPIWLSGSEWEDDIRNEAAARQLERMNATAPQPWLFRRPKGDNKVVMRVVGHPDGTLLVDEMDDDAWHSELGRHLKFKRVNTSGEVQSLPPPPTIRKHYIGRPDKNFPILERMVRVPVFSKQGNLLTTRGYVADMHTYLDPSFEVPPVPTNPTQQNVDTALGWLAEPFVDFPFTDAFDGDDQLPIRLDEVDAEGHPVPNPQRGKSSYANMLAMVLQPFVQHFIDGNSPAFHIDKAKAGSGAGYLVDVAYIIAEGTRAVVRTMSDNNEEFRKAITSTLRRGDPIIFIDNINRKVDSGAFAAALTSGTWSDRVLGETRDVVIPVRTVWVLAGNNLTFSEEVMRRIVPIRLDASIPNPSRDRPPTYYKHFPLHDWLLEHRPWLVWACLVLIANWIAKGKPPGSASLGSFDHWARVLGGILAAAGVEGFLENTAAYLETKNEEVDTASDFTKALWKKFGVSEFTLDQAMGVAKNALGAVQFGLPIDPATKEHVQVRDLGAYLKRSMAGCTFAVQGTPAAPIGASNAAGALAPLAAGTEQAAAFSLVKLIFRRIDSRVHWRFSPVPADGGGQK